MRINHLVSLLLLVALLPSAAYGAGCSDQFQASKEPLVAASAVPAKLHDICYSEYDVMYSGETFTAIWSAEHLTMDRIKKASHVPRKGQFFADPNVPTDERATNTDYSKSGYSKGHMSPSHDFSTLAAQNECFSLANMVPQNQSNNGGLWAQIENTVRGIAIHDGDVYVVTGPIFDSHPATIKGREKIPTRLFKAIYVPSIKQAGVYISDNKANSDWQAISVADLEKMTGIDAFPGLSTSTKTALMQLPAPTGKH
jgi:endonuclease G